MKKFLSLLLLFSTLSQATVVAPSAYTGKGSSSPLTTKGDLFTRSSSADARLAVGTDGQALTSDAASTNGIKWADIFSSPLTTKGDILGYSTVPARLAVGTNGFQLVADSSTATGLKWQAAAAGTGNVTQINADTTAAVTLTTGTTGTDFAIVDDAAGDHKFNLPSASATARGLVSTGAQTFAGAKTFSTIPAALGTAGGTSTMMIYGDFTTRNPQAGALSWNFQKDVNAGDTTAVGQITVGNSGSAQGNVKLGYTNAAATGAPNGYIAFDPRLNDDSSNYNAARIQLSKASSGNGGSILFRTATTTPTLTTAVTIDAAQGMQVGGQLTASQTTDSTSSTTGGMLVSGGLGVAKSIYQAAAQSIVAGLYHLEASEVDDGNSGTADTLDLSAGSAHKSTLTGNVTYTLSNPTVGGSYVIRIIQGASAYTVTWPASLLWSGGTAPVITVTNGKQDLVNLYWNGTSYLGSFTQNF